MRDYRFTFGFLAGAVASFVVVALVTILAGCLPADQPQPEQVVIADTTSTGSDYPLSVNMAVADLKAAFAAAVEVDSTATLLALVGLIQQHGLPVAPFGYGREHWTWPLAECGAFAVKYMVHYEADFIVDLPEFAVWADTTRMIGSSLQVAGIDTSGRMGGFSVPGVTGAGVLAEYPLAPPCDNAGGE